MNFDSLDLNSLPVWVVATALVLWLIPRILKEFAAFVPALSQRIEAGQERQDALLHHQMNSKAAEQAQAAKLQDRMLGILEGNLERAWQDREDTQAHLSAIKEEIAQLKHYVARQNDILGAHGGTITKLSDDIEDLRNQGWEWRPNVEPTT